LSPTHNFFSDANRDIKERKEESFFTPYAPAVLTLREPSTAIPLGCGVSFPENTVYADVVIADSPLCDLAEFNFQQGRRARIQQHEPVFCHRSDNVAPFAGRQEG
jgi:hypothetical protein